MPRTLVKNSLYKGLESFDNIEVLTNKHVLSLLTNLFVKHHNIGKNIGTVCEEIKKHYESINQTPKKYPSLRKKIIRLRESYKNANKFSGKFSESAKKIRKEYFEALKNPFDGISNQPQLPDNSCSVNSKINLPTCSNNIDSKESSVISSRASSCDTVGKQEVKLQKNVKISTDELETINRYNMPFRPSAKLLKVSKSTLHSRVTRDRKNAVRKAKECLDRSQNYVLHFDGRAFFNTGKQKDAERVCFVLTRTDKRQELTIGIPFVDNKGAQCIASKAMEVLKEWHLEDCITSLGFDTTAVNTGRLNGVATRLSRQNALNKNLIWLPCRHHIAELVLGNVISEWEGSTSGPKIIPHDSFKEKWNAGEISDLTYDKYFNDSSKFKGIAIEKYFKIQEAIETIKGHLARKQIRDDYKELLELALVFLGHHRYKVQKPGSTSRARWIQKAIYAFKIYMAHQEAKIEKKQMETLRKICLFLVFVYIPYWYDCTNGFNALKNDIQFIEDIKLFGKISKKISDAAFLKFQKHLWYMGYHLSALGFFDDRISVQDKRKMVEKLKNEVSNEEGKRRFVPKGWKEPIFEDFISKSSLEFFEIMQIETSFFDIEPEKWDTNDDYLNAKNKLSYLHVVNDAAERALSSMKNITLKNEENIQDAVISKSFAKKQ